jgi:hypothetical protein
MEYPFLDPRPGMDKDAEEDYLFWRAARMSARVSATRALIAA